MLATSIAVVNYDPGERHGRHAHDYANVSVVLGGSLRERVGRAEAVAGPLSVVVKPAGTEHEDVFGPQGARLLRLKIPSGWDAAGSGASADEWRWLTSAPAVRWLLRLAAAGAPWTPADGMAECLGAVGDTGPSPRLTSLPDWLLRIRERIRDEQGRGTRVGDLARDAGVHPVYLTRRFRHAFGCSVVACIQAERVRVAADALARTEEPISRVAYDAGFADQAHMTRALSRASGLTPAVYRDLALGRTEVANVQERTGRRG